MTAHHIRSYVALIRHNDRHSAMSDGTTREQGPPSYEIRVKGHLGSRWGYWFDGLTLTAASDGTTLIHGPVVDQAALHGLLRRLRDLGLTLISVTPTDGAELPSPSADPSNDAHNDEEKS
jgi:hypothetical protein